MATPNRSDPSEYGGRDGIIQKSEDGHVELTAQEQAMIARSEGRRMAGVDVDLPKDDLHREAVDEILKDRETRMNGYKMEGQ